jgi:glycosyltransferase involved in cell wall biosynthesis
MTTQSSVDVFVPCYRYGKFLRECVASILAQDVPVRVLIIDDASPDDSAEVAAELALKDDRVSVVRHTTNKGHIATFNEGIEWASAEYMLLLSADDYLLPGALRRAVALMDANPDVTFAFGPAIDLVNGSDQVPHSRANLFVRAATGGRAACVMSGVEFFEFIQSSDSMNVIRTPTAVVRTQAQKRAGGYLPELPHAGDLEMWLRLAAHGSVGVLDAYQAVYRFHGNNMQYRCYPLADLEQRKAAFDCVFASCGHLLPNGQQRHQRLLRPLAYQAIRFAGSAFNEGERDISERLSAFAASIEPNIHTSMLGIVLSCKKYLGIGPTRAVVRTLAKLRRLTAS